MINITNKIDCCGCEACAQSCPRQCITMQSDEEGFLYPKLNKDTCIDCSLCNKVCPVINQNHARKPTKVIAAKNRNEEIRRQSSSGGIFTKLAESVIREGGVVFGARFDENWNVVHTWTDKEEGLAAFRGSKYTQSKIGGSYIKVKEFLKDNRQVLFTGTPCQIAGLKKYLRKEYDNLLCVDIACHGVPSPLVWHEYLQSERNAKTSEIEEISFRNKDTGWKNYSFSIRFSDNKEVSQVFRENLFMQVFLKDLCIRPSCTACPAKKGKSGSDITIADYWGIEKLYPEFDDDKGVSLVLINSSKGIKMVDSFDIDYIETTYNQALENNKALENSIENNKYALEFWKLFHNKSFHNKGIERIIRSTRPFNVRIKFALRSFILSISSKSMFYSIRNIFRKSLLSTKSCGLLL